MSNAQEGNLTVNDEMEQAIVEYLRAHPEFFNRHLELVETLRLPYPGRPVVSLFERQLLLLREQNAQLHSKIQALVAVARDNGRVSKHMQRLALTLIEATGLDELLQGIKSVLRDEFNADFTALRLAARPAEAILADEREFLAPAALTLFEPLLRSGKPLCGQLSGEQVRYLFSESAPRIASAALIPLEGIGWYGLLAVGSADEARFHLGMGTLFLSRMGELISHALQPYLRSFSPGLTPPVPPFPSRESR